MEKIYLYANAIDLLKAISDDTTCPMHIAAEIDQILEQMVAHEDAGSFPWTPLRFRLPNEELAAAKAANPEQELYPCLVVRTEPLVPNKRFVTKAFYDGKRFWDTECICITHLVTHWAPMPEMPPMDRG